MQHEPATARRSIPTAPGSARRVRARARTSYLIGHVEAIMPGTSSSSRKRYSAPELRILGDIATLTREHTGARTVDLPFGSQDEIKSNG